MPVARLTLEERDRLMKLEEHLHQCVVGQDEAVTAVARAVRRARTGMADPKWTAGVRDKANCSPRALAWY
jgi:ATP-dependent Clp protease ATP-binding subunit ClpC